MTFFEAAGDCISRTTCHFHRTTVKQGRVWHLGNDPSCLGIEATDVTV